MLFDKPKAVSVALLALAVSCGRGAADEPAKKPDPATVIRLERLWADLASADEGRAVRDTRAGRQPEGLAPVPRRAPQAREG